MSHEDLKLFPRDEDWSTGDEHLDKKLNLLLLKNFQLLNDASIADFYWNASAIKTRVVSSNYQTIIDMSTKALLALKNPNSEVDQEFIKLKAQFHSFEKDLEPVNLELGQLHSTNYQRAFGSIDFFKREQVDFEHSPFLSFKIKRASSYFEVKALYKDTLEKLAHPKIDETFSHIFLAKLSKKKIVRLVGVGLLWVHQGKINCVNESAIS